jgi:hypothetical protein
VQSELLLTLDDCCARITTDEYCHTNSQDR